jgi:MFS superfamily sulfate permease-like transporter
MNTEQKIEKKGVFAYWKKDVPAGIITGAMAIPLSVGICLMSDYPILTGLYTVIFACVVGFIFSLFRPGNFVGVPGIAAGLAPVLALGVSWFGMENMAFVILLTSVIQALIWYFNWQKYILQTVPKYLVEGLLAGIGLKISMKFLPFLFEAPIDNGTKYGDILAHPGYFMSDNSHLTVIGVSLVCFVVFILLTRKFSKVSPGIPYFGLIILAVIVGLIFNMKKVDIGTEVPSLHLPMLHFDRAINGKGILILEMIGYALMLSVIDVIEQVMSNAAIEKLDPLKRKCDTNNSLLAIWVSNLGSSFFGGMTNLDGLAKSTTNAVAGAITKLSNLIVAFVVTIIVIFPWLLSYIPEFAFGIIMVFSGFKMILGLRHIMHEGEYAVLLALMCGILVFKLGIFEGLLIALAVHAVISYVIGRSKDGSTRHLFAKFMEKFKAEDVN